MGPLFVLVCLCLRENVIVTCKVVSFLYSLDNFLLKNVIVFFFWKLNVKMALIWKRGYFWPNVHIFSHQGRDTKIPSAYISLIHTYTYFAHPIDFFALPILQKIRIFHLWFLFGVTPGVDSYSRHFGAIVVTWEHKDITSVRCSDRVTAPYLAFSLCAVNIINLVY